MASKKIVVLYLNKFHILFPDKEIKKNLIDLWVDIFKGELDKNFEIACNWALKNINFFPAPAKVFEELEKIQCRITIGKDGKKYANGVPYVE